MNGALEIFERTAQPAGAAAENVVLSLLLAFVLGQLIGWAYTATHTGLSYSRSFTQSLVLLAVIVSIVMLVIGNNIVTAFGLIGALAIIRFRNVLKDTRDTVFVFLSLVIGMAVGSQKYVTATLGTIGVILVMLYLHFTRFGSIGRFDGHLSFLVGSSAEDAVFDAVLQRFCRSMKRVSARRDGGSATVEYVFEVRLRDRDRGQEMVDELTGTPGVSNVALVLRDELAEV